MEENGPWTCGPTPVRPPGFAPTAGSAYFVTGGSTGRGALYVCTGVSGTSGLTLQRSIGVDAQSIATALSNAPVVPRAGHGPWSAVSGRQPLDANASQARRLVTGSPADRQANDQYVRHVMGFGMRTPLPVPPGAPEPAVASVHAIATTNLTALAPQTNINGVVVVEKDRVLLTNQDSKRSNGIYVVTANGALVRRSLCKGKPGAGARK